MIKIKSAAFNSFFLVYDVSAPVGRLSGDIFSAGVWEIGLTIACYCYYDLIRRV